MTLTMIYNAFPALGVLATREIEGNFVSSVEEILANIAHEYPLWWDLLSIALILFNFFIYYLNHFKITIKFDCAKISGKD